MNNGPVWMGGVEKHSVPVMKYDRINPPADDIPERNERDEPPEPPEADELRTEARGEMQRLYKAGLMGPGWAEAWKGILGATNLPKPVREFDPQSGYWREYGRFAQLLKRWVKAGHEPDKKTELAGLGETEYGLFCRTLRSYLEASR